MSWDNMGSVQSENSCDAESLGKYFKFLIQLKQHPTASIISESGCMTKCKTSQYSVEITRSKGRLQYKWTFVPQLLLQVDWASNWTSSVFIQPKSSLIEYSVEYLSYDLNDLIGDIGGYLGLFLGWSLVTFYDAVPLIITFVTAKTKNT